MANEQNLKSWIPGQSGNKAGKPKGTKHLSTWIQEMLNDESFTTLLRDNRLGYKEYTGAPIQAIVMVGIMNALQGDYKWAEWLAKRGYGNEMDITSGGKELASTTCFECLMRHQKKNYMV